MKRKGKTILCMLLALCMAAMFLPASLAEEQPATPPDLTEDAPALRQNKLAAPKASYDPAVYSADDVNAINAIIDKNGLKATKDDPASWSSFATWNIDSPKRLTKLSIDRAGMTGSLNVNGLTALTYLNCSDNQLGSLNVSGLTALTSLNCYDNQLGSLNVSGLTALTSLNCYDNQLGSLNVSGLTALEELNCSYNQLRSLNVSGLTALTSLNCYDNQLGSLNVSDLTSLEELSCSNNQLRSLNVSGLTALDDLSCSNNPLSSLDLTGLSDQIEVSCSLSQLTNPDGHTLTVGTAENGFAVIKRYGRNAQGNSAPGEVRINAYAKNGYTFNQWNDGSTDNPLYEKSAQSETITPIFTPETDPLYHAGDLAALETILTDHQLDGKYGIRLGYLSTYPADWQEDSEAQTNKRLIELDLSEFGLTGSLDARELTALVSLECYSNQLTSLNVSGLNSLVILSCADNQLTSLDVSGLPIETASFFYGNNPLSSLKLPDGKSVAISVTGGGQPWLEDFDYYDGGQRTYTAKAAPGYGNADWRDVTGFTDNADGSLSFNVSTMADNLSATLTFSRKEALTADPSTVEIIGDGVQPGGQVQVGSTFTFTANPIETSAPNDPFNGDIRYMPVSYEVHSNGRITGGFANGQYTQSFSTASLEPGDHTLTVTYEKQTYNGTMWEPMNGETITKQLGFSLTAIASPDDNNPGGNTPGGNTPQGNTPGGGSGTNGANGGTTANPGTGDAGYAWYVIGLLLAGGGMLLLTRKKKTA